MNVKRGHIYLVDFGNKYQSDIGKIRPAVVWQSDFINESLDVAEYKSVIVIPCTTDIKGGQFRVNLSPRERLERKSEMILNWMCSVDLSRLKDREALARLTPIEEAEARKKLEFIFGYMDI